MRPFRTARMSQTISNSSPHSRDPLHGVTLEKILLHLVAEVGWSEMGQTIPIRCFQFNPTIKSSLVFLRRTPWARKRVEEMYCSLRPVPNASRPGESSQIRL